MVLKKIKGVGGGGWSVWQVGTTFADVAKVWGANELHFCPHMLKFMFAVLIRRKKEKKIQYL